MGDSPPRAAFKEHNNATGGGCDAPRGDKEHQQAAGKAQNEHFSFYGSPPPRGRKGLLSTPGGGSVERKRGLSIRDNHAMSLDGLLNAAPYCRLSAAGGPHGGPSERYHSRGLASTDARGNARNSSGSL